MRGDNQDECRVASSRNAPEPAGHCLTRMLPWPHHLVNRRRRKDGFPVRSLGLLSRPDLTPSEPRSATQGMGGAEPPGATRRAPWRTSMARMASTGPSATLRTAAHLIPVGEPFVDERDSTVTLRIAVGVARVHLPEERRRIPVDARFPVARL
jgi:hypothetical protein